MTPGGMQELLERAFDTITEGVFVLLLNGTFMYFNNSAERVFGIKRSDVVGRHLQDAPWRALDLEGRPYALEQRPIWRTLVSETPLTQIELIVERADGSRVIVSSDSVPLRGRKGQKIGVVCSIRDITERKRAEGFEKALGKIDETLLSAEKESVKEALALGAKALGARSGTIIVKSALGWRIHQQFGEIKGAATRSFTDSEIRLNLTGEPRSPFRVAVPGGRFYREALGELADAFILVIPLSLKGKLVGLMLFGMDAEKEELSELELGFAEKLATELSLSLENSRLYSEAIKRSEMLEIISQIISLIAGTLSIDEVLTQIVNYAALLLDAPAAVVCSLRAEQRQLPTCSTLGMSAALSKQSIAFEEALSLGIQVDRPVVFNDLRKLDSIPYFRIAADEGFVGSAVVGIYMDGILAGLLIVQDKKEIYLDDLGKLALKTFANHAGIAIRNAERFTAERHIANTLQRAILQLPGELPGIEYGHRYRSAAERAQVGGDFYDLFQLGEKRIGITIGDVSGKGLDAAVLTALAKNTIKAYAAENGTPSEVLAKTNEIVFESSSPSDFITVFFATLDTETGKLTYCNAGHPAPILRRQNARPELLEYSSPLVGAFKELAFFDRTVDLVSGDELVLYTDGMVELPADGHVFDQHYLLEFIDSLGRDITAEKLPAAMIAKFAEVSGGRFFDDIAVLCVQWNGPAK